MTKQLCVLVVLAVSRFAVAQPAGTAPLHRLWSGTAGDHFYTSSDAESSAAQSCCGYAYEKVEAYVYPSQAAGTTPMYRTYCPGSADHFYTSNATTYQQVISMGCSGEGIAFYVYPTQAAGTVPLYRLWCNAAQDHFYTASETDKDAAISYGCYFDGPAPAEGYVYPPTSAVNTPPKGWIDGVNTSTGWYAHGWAYDPDVPGTSITVQLNIDGMAVASMATPDYRQDVNAYFGITGNHGFLFTIPEAYRTGSHTLAVYAIDANGGPAVQIGTSSYSTAMNRAGFGSQTVPSAMNAGATASVSVTMTNTGSTTWSASRLYALGSQNPGDNTTWGLGRVSLAGDVPPGGSATFTFNITAPATPGTYNFQWRMVQDGVEWFGDSSTNVAVDVLSAGTLLADVPNGTTQLYRLFKASTNRHMYTSNSNERKALIASGWVKDRAVGFVIPPAAGTLPLYRLHIGDRYLMTTDTGEKNNLASSGWTFDGIVGYIYASQVERTQPLHRLRNPATGDQLYTMSPGERDYSTTTQGYVYENISGYLLFQPPGNIDSPHPFVTLDGTGRPQGVDRSYIVDVNKFWSYAKIPAIVPDANGKFAYDIFLKPNPTADDAGTITVNGVGYGLRPLHMNRYSNSSTIWNGERKYFQHTYFYDAACPPGPELSGGANLCGIGGCPLGYTDTYFHYRQLRQPTGGTGPCTGAYNYSFVDVVRGNWLNYQYGGDLGITFGQIAVNSVLYRTELTYGYYGTSAYGGATANAYILPEGNGHIGLLMSQTEDLVNHPPLLVRGDAFPQKLEIAVTGDQYGTFFLTFPGHPELGGYVFVDPATLKGILGMTKLGGAVMFRMGASHGSFGTMTAGFLIAYIAGTALMVLEIHEIAEADGSAFDTFRGTLWEIAKLTGAAFIINDAARESVETGMMAYEGFQVFFDGATYDYTPVAGNPCGTLACD